MKRIPRSELKTYNILLFGNTASYGIQTRLLRKQFPRKVRDKILFDVGKHEGVPWVAIHRNDKQDAWWNIIRRGDATVLASAPMLPITKRFENMLIEYATIDPELIAYVLISL
jgi:hypothetical protein